MSPFQLIRIAKHHSLCSEPTGAQSGSTYNNGARSALREVARLIAVDASEERALCDLIDAPQATMTIGGGK
jgi:hypothetical protein